jgi:hypothetical protein
MVFFSGLQVKLPHPLNPPLKHTLTTVAVVLKLNASSRRNSKLLTDMNLNILYI